LYNAVLAGIAPPPVAPGAGPARHSDRRPSARGRTRSGQKGKKDREVLGRGFKTTPSTPRAFRPGEAGHLPAAWLPAT
jgi:hypothetical protein